MANYISSTQKRSSMPDKSLLMSAYVRLRIHYEDDAAMETKRNNMKEMSYLVSEVIHRDVEAEVMIREGSVIVEVVAMGDLYELLSKDNLAEIGIITTGAAAALIEFQQLRRALVTLKKDIQRATAALSMYARSIFSARLGDVVQLEARTGIIGNFLRFLDACDVARSEDISVESRQGAMERAYSQLVTINTLTKKSQDRALAFKYIRRELNRIPPSKAPKGKNALTLKEMEAKQKFDQALTASKKIAG